MLSLSTTPPYIPLAWNYALCYTGGGRILVGNVYFEELAGEVLACRRTDPIYLGM